MKATQAEAHVRDPEQDHEQEFILTEPFKDAARFVSNAMRHGSGLYLITGPVGAGKSLVLDWCRQQAPDNIIHVATPIRRVDFDNLSRFLSHVLRVQQAPEITAQALALRYFLKLGTLRTKGMRFVVILDNVEEIHSGGAELLKALLQMKDESEPLVTVILSGDSTLAALLDGSFRWGIHKLIRQSHQMKALTVDQTVNFANELASPEDGIPIPVTTAAAKQIHRESQGIPRRISRLTEGARRIARHAGASRVTPRMVHGAIDGSYRPLGSAILERGLKYGVALLVLLLLPLFPLQMDLPVVHLADSPPQLDLVADSAPALPIPEPSTAPSETLVEEDTLTVVEVTVAPVSEASLPQRTAAVETSGTVPLATPNDLPAPVLAPEAIEAVDPMIDTPVTIAAASAPSVPANVETRWNTAIPAMALQEDGIGLDETLLAGATPIRLPAQSAISSEPLPAKAESLPLAPATDYRLEILDFAAAMENFYAGFRDRISATED